jgi:23S rRNA pseudouridine1911/1915/1917 synthase
MSVHTHSAREAVTTYLVKERYRDATLVEVEIKTGRTHQIRVHMAHVGHPVLGDRVYGGSKAAKHAERQMLHAESLSLLHPVTGHPMTFTAPPPEDMREMLEKLRLTKRVSP